MIRIALYGGSFDPVHNGHIGVARSIVDTFRMDEFVFIPAYHAPHKKGLEPTPAIDRYAMLSLATNDEALMSISKIEIEAPTKPYTIETVSRLQEMLPDAQLFFVMGADSWDDIRTWREWERLLLMTNHIVMSRPGYPIDDDHVTDDIRGKIVDLRGSGHIDLDEFSSGPHIFFCDDVSLDASATAIRKMRREGDHDWREDVPEPVAKYIEKYDLYR